MQLDAFEQEYPNLLADVPESVPPAGGYSGRGFPDDLSDFLGRDKFFEERGLSWARDFNDRADALMHHADNDSLIIEFDKQRMNERQLALPGCPSEVWESSGACTIFDDDQPARTSVFARYRKISCEIVHCLADRGTLLSQPGATEEYKGCQSLSRRKRLT